MRRSLIVALCLLSGFLAHAGENKPLDPQNYRYSIFQMGHPVQTYMLDRQTGKIWKASCLVNGTAMYGQDCRLSGWKTDLVEGVDISKDEIEALRHAQN